MKSFREILEAVDDGKGEKPYPKMTHHGWWQDNEYLHMYHGTHKRNVKSIRENGINRPDPRTGKVSMTFDPNTAHGYAAMSSGGGEHHFRKADANPVVTPHEDRAVTHWKIPRKWAEKHMDHEYWGNLGDMKDKMKHREKYDQWKSENPHKSDHEYYATSELRFSKPIPASFYQGHSFRYKK